ncbi:hypothetical protein [Bradyrhizobium sp. CB1015]|uniref:hypothetical protein n=1 Tax=Bradyrhizobium sp. CB1015 TaxID=2976822 RepID=UPI0021A9ABB7|nr:hypothetical protein [Bradyrhizobium sp. CB1015]UWU94157.1 hypothetical protein N2604_09980 [Bradyrhizobium sp. CB1015]
MHAVVERMFAEAREKVGISEDTAFDLAVASLKSRGLHGPIDKEDASDAQDIVLREAGFADADELSEALEAYPDGKAPVKLRAVSAALGILGGDKRPPTVSYCLSQFLEEKARGRDVTKKDWVNYERERKRIVGEFVKLVGVNKEINDLSRQDARGFVKKLEDAALLRTSKTGAANCCGPAEGRAGRTAR